MTSYYIAPYKSLRSISDVAEFCCCLSLIRRLYDSGRRIGTQIPSEKSKKVRSKDGDKDMFGLKQVANDQPVNDSTNTMEYSSIH